MKKNKRNRGLVVLLLLLILGISIGYAAISSDLTINTIANIGKAKWDVHFSNIVKNENNVTATIEPTISEQTEINYSVNLEKPGDFYEFTIDVVNAGTLNAVIAADGVANTELTETQDIYANYTVTYADGTEIAAGDTLYAGETKTIKVRIEYDNTITSEQLNNLTGNISLSLTASLNYVQE